MSDSYTEVTSENWFSRIGGSIKGILFGFLLLLIACVLLFWNEGRAVKRYKTLEEGGGLVISVQSEAVDPGNNNILIHLSGRAESLKTLVDPELGVQATNAIKLKRTVEMYQWQETTETTSKKKLGGSEEKTTTYTYSKSWSDRPVSSANFKKPEGHSNPDSMSYHSSEYTAKQVTLEAYTLPHSLVAKITTFSPLPLSHEVSIPAALGTKTTRETNGFYVGSSSSTPQVGDLRISYQVVTPLEVSIVSMQSGQTLAPYHTEAGGNIELLQTGMHTAQAMFQQAQQSNTIMTWLIRGGGFLLMFIGTNMILRPLAVLADIIPFLGSLVGAGTGFIAFLFSGVVSFITIGIAWIVFRPLVGIIALAIAGVLGFFIFSKMKKAEPVQATTPPPPPPPPIG